MKVKAADECSYMDQTIGQQYTLSLYLDTISHLFSYKKRKYIRNLSEIMKKTQKYLPPPTKEAFWLNMGL